MQGHDYRERALKILPHVCARCGREFEGRRLRELTVHHKDGNHHHNPPDGSNWELLCVYCHENEHARFEDARAGGGSEHGGAAPATHRPFSALNDLLKKKPRG
jgi:hypothetical protein